jgi:hypothetical protein
VHNLMRGMNPGIGSASAGNPNRFIGDLPDRSLKLALYRGNAGLLGLKAMKSCAVVSYAKCDSHRGSTLIAARA